MAFKSIKGDEMGTYDFGDYDYLHVVQGTAEQTLRGRSTYLGAPQHYSSLNTLCLYLSLRQLRSAPISETRDSSDGHAHISKCFRRTTM